jgi:opacity protein-like surface antigen
MRTRTVLFTTAALALLAAPALAQQNGNSEIRRTSLATVPVAPEGLGFQLGGGVTGFSREATRDQFGTGGYWDARVVYGTRSWLGAELAYVGSAREAQLSGGPQLMGNGAEAALRGNLPLQVGQLRLSPFVFAGLGWTYYSAIDDEIGSNIKDGNALTIPYGAGLSGSYRGFTLDARFTYRSVFDDDLVQKPGAAGEFADLQNWAAGITLGYEI